MPDRQTNRIVQVCRDTYPEEKASGLSKTSWWGSICLGVKDCLHREGERREIFQSERWQTHEGGPGDRDLLVSALTSTGTALQYPRFPKPLPPQKNLEAARKQKCVFFRG